MRELSDHVALVTGSARRLGKEIALELAKAGCNILLHYGTSAPATVQDTLRELEKFEISSVAKQADLSRVEEIKSLIRSAVEHFGRLDILVNSAAIFQRRNFLDVTREDWEQTLAINLRAPFFLTQEAAKIMKRNSSGSIINIGDYGSLQPWPQFPHHGISKAALIMLTRTSAVSLAPEIRVNAIIPGPVLRPDDMDVQSWSKITQNTPLGWGGNAQSVAKAVRYLVSETAISGAIIPIDGGQSLTPPTLSTQ